jgi:hypothetical protein
LPEFLHRSALQRLVDCKGLACDSEL